MCELDYLKQTDKPLILKGSNSRVLVGWDCQRPHEIIHSLKCGLIFFIRPLHTEYTLFLTLPDQICPKGWVSFRDKLVSFRNHFFNNLPKISAFGSISWIWDLPFIPFHHLHFLLNMTRFHQENEPNFYFQNNFSSNEHSFFVWCECNHLWMNSKSYSSELLWEELGLTQKLNM